MLMALIGRGETRHMMVLHTPPLQDPGDEFGARIRCLRRLLWVAAILLGAAATYYRFYKPIGFSSDFIMLAVVPFGLGGAIDRVVSGYYRRDAVLGLFTVEGFKTGLPFYILTAVMFLLNSV